MPDIVSSLRRRRNGDAGFTLVEIVVGIAIMVIGLMGLAFAMVSSYRMERVAAEKKIALTWVSAQLERVRSLGYGEMTGPPRALVDGTGAPLTDASGNNIQGGGYLVPLAWGVTPVGFRIKELPSGPVYFERWFHAPGTKDFAKLTPAVPLADPGLAGLRPVDGMKSILTDPKQEPFTASALSPQPWMDNIMGRVCFRMPEASLNGVGPGSGYWVTVRLRWKGISGPAEMKVSTFIGR